MIKARKLTDVHRTELDPHHVARLHEIPFKQDRTRYACQVLHRLNPSGVSTAAVMAWLAAYGYGENDPHGQKRNRVSPVVAAYRRQHNLDTTSSRMPHWTPAGMSPIPPVPDEGVVVPFPSIETPGIHPTGRPTTTQVSPPAAPSDPGADAFPRQPATGPDASATWPDTTATEAIPSRGVADRTPEPAGQHAEDASGFVPARPAVTTALAEQADTVTSADDVLNRTTATAKSTAEDTRPALDRTPPVKLMIRFGWQTWAAPVLALIGCALVLASGAGVVADRLLATRLLPLVDWRIAGAAGIAGALVIALAGITWRNAPRRQVTLQPLSVEARVFYFGFTGALAASADASFRVWHDVLHVHLWEAAAFFTVVEILLLGSGLAMRSNLKRTGRPGMYGSVVWLLSGFGVVAALLVSEWPGSLWRALGGPVASVLALHLALGLELRATGTRQRFSRLGQALRSVGQHLLSYVGAGTGDQTWIVIRRERALTRAARLASKPELTPWSRHRLARATRASGAGRSDTATADLLRALAAERATDALLTMPTLSPWDGATWIDAPATLAHHARQPEHTKSSRD
ncbi:hypothetical protein [Amycolatopsis sp. NPDC051371]|uniref:hypothetical protein n=1 Tax=Amycolatopsis sp. NPDC051371 TaxID=3155800 RepID=UPI00343D7E87